MAKYIKPFILYSLYIEEEEKKKKTAMPVISMERYIKSLGRDIDDDLLFASPLSIPIPATPCFFLL